MLMGPGWDKMATTPQYEERGEHEPTFGGWLKTQRLALDLSQEALARRVGCSRDLIGKIEAGVRRPSRQVAELLAEALNVAPR